MLPYSNNIFQWFDSDKGLSDKGLSDKGEKTLLLEGTPGVVNWPCEGHTINCSIV